VAFTTITLQSSTLHTTFSCVLLEVFLHQRGGSVQARARGLITVTPDFAGVQCVTLSHSLKDPQIVLGHPNWLWVSPCY